MTKAEIARRFDVSRQTVDNWANRGCPVDGPAHGIAEWVILRDTKDRVLAELAGENVRRIDDLDKRRESVAKHKDEGFRLMVGYALLLEATILELPNKILVESNPKALPADLFRIVHNALDEAKGSEDSTGDLEG